MKWLKGDSMFMYSNKRRGRHHKVSVSSKGLLKIKTVGLRDSGVYQCKGMKGRLC